MRYNRLLYFNVYVKKDAKRVKRDPKGDPETKIKSL